MLKTRLIFLLIFFALSPVGCSSHYEKAFRFYKEKNYRQAEPLMRELAETGDPQAQLCLAKMYYLGEDIAEDYFQAIKWYSEAIKVTKQSDETGDFKWGKHYAENTGIKQNYELAKVWFEKSATQGNAEAAYYLGLMYEEGKGGDKNYPFALSLYEKSANQGYTKAQIKLGGTYFGDRDVNHAMDLWRQAAEQGDAEAQRLLDDVYQYGENDDHDRISSLVDINQAIYWYEKAAMQGDKEAIADLEQISSCIECKAEKTKAKAALERAQNH